ncbi:FAD/NAD(P)-binding protein [Arthrobacter sp. Sa2BUA2]|uniref:FAD/NAD(P)-binding protein n=1 Tax=Arthrobacter pullicola TaxID=2762224 RepID=A0ABR8YKI6_9MICC|nr:FAD/NAD(P)-binding protein [Arthrobacter pullicola]MBD8044761.1 FAD/NAD(P)-binding protein [Arthrobacter pullicola]
MDKPQRLRVAVIGAGPRGVSVLDRLLARYLELPADERPALEIRMVDPFTPGPGHVWRTNQSRLFLMNTPCLFPTVAPAPDQGFAPSVSGLSFGEWAQAMAEDPAVTLSAGDLEEIARLDPGDFPTRAVYGRYLEWTYTRLAAAAEQAGAAVVHHRTEVLSLTRNTAGFTLELAGEADLSADVVVLAVGHLPAALNPEQSRLSDAAARLGLRYLPPAVPSDADFSVLPAGEHVLVRGLGLNFFDIMAQVTLGRGGRFVPTGEPAGRSLRYEPSGREPVLVAASRRGTPYRAKAKLQSYLPKSVNLRWFTREAAGSFAVEGIQPGFDHDFWPLLHRDAIWAYYSTLARTAPGCLTVPAGDFLRDLEAALTVDGPDWDPAKEEVLQRCVPAEHRTSLEALAQPLGRRPFSGAADVDAAVLAYLEADAAGSAKGEDDPLKMAIGALNAGRSVLKAVVADGGLSEESWLTELRGWFEPLVEGLASGPPPERIEQLAALTRAGLVHFVGPDPRFDVDEARAVFTASSPWSPQEYAATTVVEAMMPANRVSASLSPLLEGMLHRGLARPKVMMAADGTPVMTSGLDVSLPPYRPLDIKGEPQPDLYVLGLQLSSVQWGTAIAAEAGAPADAGARTLRDADDIAAAILAGSGPDGRAATGITRETMPAPSP